MNLPSASLWEFSNTVYHRPGVEAALLTLQQRVGVDVNMLLLCCWAARHRHQRIDAAGMGELVGKASSWQGEVVRPLRRLRQRLKGGFEGVPRIETQTLREKVLALELEAEHVEQDYLAAELPRRAASLSAEQIRAGAVDNSVNYFRVLNVELDEELLGCLVHVLAAAVDIDKERAAALWRESSKRKQ
jgi:uncharacterized protein (TIGR02444 family)